jgi:tetratricopeptide (TPR) repeat protein
MANIFLSYDRDDEARARPIAALLERAGHSVWWDRQIKGGGEFGAEIEAALNAADKVVVLWSERAARSAWVRDEAAVGRDTGRLVPATLDGTPPPLGFRQFQTIDLSKWKGRGSSPQLSELIDALGAPQRTVASARAKRRRDLKPLARPLLLVGSVILGLAAAVWLWRSAVTPDEPRIAITSADGSELSRQVARDLALRVPNLSGADTSAYELVDASQTSSPKADLVLTAGAASSGGRERRDLVLRVSNDAILWSASIDQPAAASTNLPQQLAIQAQRALSCAADAMTYRRERIRQDTLKLYLSGCTSFDNAYGANAENTEHIKLFEQVLAQAPHFEPAWARLLASEIDELDSVDDPRSLQRKMVAQIAQAQHLGLDFGELYAARAATHSPVDFIGIFRAYDEGIKRHPDNALLYRSRGEQYFHVGRMNDAVGDSAHAVQLDPLSPANQQALASAYAYAGNAEAGFAQLRKAEQLWPGAPTIVFARYRLDLRYGDPKEGLKLLQDPIEQGPLQSEQAAFLKARLDPTPENIERSIAEDQKIYRQYPDFITQIVQTLAQFGRKDEVLDILLKYSGGELSGLAAEVLFRPALRDVWRDPRSMSAAAHLGLLHYWKVSGNWPDFCSDPTLPYDCKKEAAKYRA